MNERSAKLKEKFTGFPYSFHQWGRRLLGNTSSRIVNDQIRKIIPEEGLVLEVGSGSGYLASILPEELLRRLIQIDHSPKAMAENKRGRQVCLDITAPGDFFEAETFSMVLGVSSLDNIIDLEIALENIHSLLKPGGVLLHFLDLYPNDWVILSRMNPQELVFPFTTINNEPGFQLVPEKEFVARYSSLTKEGKELFDAYLAEDCILSYAWLRRWAPDYYAKIEKVISRLNIASYKSNLLDIFRRNFEAAVSGSRLNIMEAGLKTESEVGEINQAQQYFMREAVKGFCNKFESAVGVVNYSYDASVPEGKASMINSIYVLAAQKPNK